MEPENQPVPSMDPEFVIKISGYGLFIKRFLLVATVWFLISSVIESLRSGQFGYFLAGGLNAALCYVVARYGIRTFPRKVSLEGDSIVFHKVPTAWFPINGIPIPLGITQREVWPIGTVALERIYSSLSLNDIKRGRSIPLASGKQADSLTAWFKSVGVSDPVGG